MYFLEKYPINIFFYHMNMKLINLNFYDSNLIHNLKLNVHLELFYFIIFMNLDN
jgi:hypothetical protein